ncbi:heavy metal translocating P-type ATPase [Paenibacillus sp. S150]|uniref:heavy metal translocating P-type ATPase n=1 Tax=Paenibacillus sp. S150 TaxID=2749826 RepID=UPI001C591B0E|nr:heavy metal translocating P-type ATPase [Paenibacillus sp. S150]MBW4085306.1 cadmium-translocating P-type ATPase [Paenibacillus sp. S150]
MNAVQGNVKRQWLLEGLDCANCAMKIENKVKKIEGVSSCSVNFAMKLMTLETAAAEAEAVSAEARRTVNILEPHVKIREVKAAGVRRRPLPASGQEQAGSHGPLGRAVSHSHSHGEAHVRAESHSGSRKAHDHGEAHAHSGHSHAPGVHAASQAGSPESHSHGEAHAHGHSHAAHGHSHAAHGHAESHADSHAAHEHGGGDTRRILLRLGAGAVLAAAGMFLPVRGVTELLIFLAAYLVVGGEVVWSAVRNIVRGQVFDENFLMALATIGAFAIGEYPEGVAVMLFYQVGELFQGMAVNRSRRSITALMDIRPEFAYLKEGENLRRVSPEEVEIGEHIVVKPGEKVPLDGTILQGSAMMDTSALTGESVPRSAEPGSKVLSGFINRNGVVTIEVTRTFGESAVSKILELVQNASNNKAKTENFITKFARAYTPVVVITALLLAVLPPLLLSGASFSDWIYRALVFLVISCPCALVVSIPLGFFGGIGAASKSGILVKGSNFLEALGDVKVVVFDKTGTLTKGQFKVTGIYPAEGIGEKELLRTAAYAESHSSHPIAESVRAAYGEEISADSIADYNEISGHGIAVTVEGKAVLAGNARLMEREGIVSRTPEHSGTVVHIAVDKQYAGYLLIADEVKEDSLEAVQALGRLGIHRTVMLTGDASSVAEAVGRQLGIEEIHAGLLPQHKVEAIEKLEREKSKREKIIFVGDGINDTPVLARADVGIAMGGLGSDAAIEAADIVIMTDEPSKIATAIRIAGRTRTIVWQNIIFALAVKAIFLLLGAFGIATMWEAVFSDVGVTVLAVLNSVRALQVPKSV